MSLIGEHSFEDYRASNARAGIVYPRSVPGPASFLHFPITDFDVPAQEELEALVLELKRRSLNGECIFVHCRGGHGRTGTVVIPLIAALFDVDNTIAQSFVEKATLRTRASDRFLSKRHGYAIEIPETNKQRSLIEAVNSRVRLQSRRPGKKKPPVVLVLSEKIQKSEVGFSPVLGL